MNALISVLLGFIQGMAEFLPVSSSGHLSVLQNFLHLDYSESEHLLMDVLLHTGTLASVFVYYWRDIREMCLQSVACLKGKEGGTTATGRLSPKVRCAFYILVATVPLVLALIFNDMVESLCNNTVFIAIAFLVTGGLLYCAGKLPQGTKGEKTVTVKDALIIGLAQAVATLPGLSRSGTTITVGLSRGLKREFAVRFSFLLSLPAVIGATLLTLIKALIGGITWKLVPLYLLGMAVAFVVGYFSIQLINRLVRRASFSGFCYYCWGIGLLTLILSLAT